MCPQKWKLGLYASSSMITAKLETFCFFFVSKLILVFKETFKLNQFTSFNGITAQFT